MSRKLASNFVREKKGPKRGGKVTMYQDGGVLIKA